MLRDRLLLLLLLLVFSVTACAPGGDDGFAQVDEPPSELDGTAFHSIVGQSATEVAPGDFVVVYLASGPDAVLDPFSTQSFLACDLTNWAIEHVVSSYVAQVDSAALGAVDLDVSPGDVVSAIGLVVAEGVRTGTQMVIDPMGYDHTFLLTLRDEAM
jgi:hypothetical protein